MERPARVEPPMSGDLADKRYNGKGQLIPATAVFHLYLYGSLCNICNIAVVGARLPG